MYLTVDWVSSAPFRLGQDAVIGRMNAGWLVQDRAYTDFGYHGANLGFDGNGPVGLENAP